MGVAGEAEGEAAGSGAKSGEGGREDRVFFTTSGMLCNIYRKNPGSVDFICERGKPKKEEEKITFPPLRSSFLFLHQQAIDNTALVFITFRRGRGGSWKCTRSRELRGGPAAVLGLQGFREGQQQAGELGGSIIDLSIGWARRSAANRAVVT